MKLKSKSVLVRVEFAVLFALFSFEGRITDLDKLTLRIKGMPTGMEEAPTLVLGSFSASSFDGEIGEDETGLFVRLIISRPSPEGKTEVYRFLIEGEWQSEQAPQHTRPN